MDYCLHVTKTQQFGDWAFSVSTEDFLGWTTSPLKEEQCVDGKVYSVQQGEYLAPVLNNSPSLQEVNAKTISERVSGMEKYILTGD